VTENRSAERRLPATYPHRFRFLPRLRATSVHRSLKVGLPAVDGVMSGPAGGQAPGPTLLSLA